MLRPDEDALAIMQWRLQRITPANRWHPVLQRYISYLVARIAGLGGDPNAILPSPTGAPLGDGADKHQPTAVSGTVIEVMFDCFGHFEGFVLADCCDRRSYRSRERAVGELVLRACKEGLVITVFAAHERPECILRLVVRS
jgi:hypothetical protein